MEFFERIVTALESIASSLEILVDGSSGDSEADSGTFDAAQTGGNPCCDPTEAGKPGRRTALAIRREELAASIKAAGLDLAEIEKTLKAYNANWKSGQCDKAELLLKSLTPALAATPVATPNATPVAEAMAGTPPAANMLVTPEEHRHPMPQSLVSAGTEFMTAFGVNMLNMICKDHYGVSSLGLIPAEHYAAAEALMRSRLAPKEAAPSANLTVTAAGDPWDAPAPAPVVAAVVAPPVDKETVRRACAAHAKAVNPEATRAILVNIGKGNTLEDVAPANLGPMMEELTKQMVSAPQAAA